jgi:hypothetical protein
MAINMGEDDDWAALNRAITDGSLYTANVRQLRRYLKAALDQRRGGLALHETIQDLISNHESTRQARWTLIGAWAAIVAAIASVLGLVAMWWGK